METKPSHPTPLHVLPSSDKVNQLREEISSHPPAKKLADQTVIDRILDSSKTARQKLVEEKVIEALRTIYDPELPVNIYDLGLIYEINVAPDDHVAVKMTLTAPACPVAGTLPGEVERRLDAIEEVASAKVELVWEPAWTKDRLSEAAMLELGLM